jgi:NAD(P)-dependent dehydrogenase (short-subunit alcohol dehydrogenase family)
MEKVLITGTSRGLGRALANELSGKNYNVIASSRNIKDIENLETYKKISLDVTDDVQIKQAAQECGDIDVLINNAAYTVAGPLEAIPIKEIRKEYETNVIGPLKLIQTFIPGMRKKGKGIIVNISSSADRFAPPYGGSYSSAKAALAMMSEALHFEVSHFGIKVILIEAGAIKTNMPLKQKHFTINEYSGLDAQMKTRAKKYFQEDTRPEPDVIAKMIVEKIEDPQSKFKIPIGKDAEYMIPLRQRLSDEEWEKSSPLKKGLEW